MDKRYKGQLANSYQRTVVVFCLGAEVFLCGQSATRAAHYDRFVQKLPRRQLAVQSGKQGAATARKKGKNPPPLPPMVYRIVDRERQQPATGNPSSPASPLLLSPPTSVLSAHQLFRRGVELDTVPVHRPVHEVALIFELGRASA